jgi:tRNA uridine 5-carboxymethylaminomethyl modification enzyme
VAVAGLYAALGLPHRLDARDLLALEASERYRGFRDRQDKEIERNRRLEGLRIPPDFDYAAAQALSLEARQKLSARRPLTVGLAQRIAGVTPADVSGLIFHLSRRSPAAAGPGAD